MSASPVLAHCQHMCKRFALYVQLDCFTTYKTLLPNEKKLLKLVHYLYTVSMARHFDARSHNNRITFRNKTGC